MSAKVIWEYKYRGRGYISHWIYARISKNVSLSPQWMKQAMNGALYELSKKIAYIGQEEGCH